MTRPDSTSEEDAPCRLCLQRSELKSSHIIPQFVFRWLKDTSATGYLRWGQDMQRRKQDGPKPPLLCGVCEGRLSVWEGTFSEIVFRPLSLGQGFEPFEYGPWLAKFAASLSWRSLIYMQEMGEFTHVPMERRSRIGAASEVWRAFIDDKREFISPYDQFLVPLGFLESSSVPGVPPNINRYFGRTAEIDLVSHDDWTFVYTKMGFVVVIGVIYSARPWEWMSARLDPAGGHFGRGKTIGVPGGLILYMQDRAKNMARLTRSLSDKQKNMIERTAQKDVERTQGSISFQAMRRDVDSFGDSAFGFDSLPPLDPFP